MSVVIQVENLSKYYRLGLIGGITLREDLNRWWAKARGRPDPALKIGMEDHGNRVGGELWALRDVSFEVHEGEILGIIGRNGAGKSTLLKVLSRITAPTTGHVKIKGRVGSLLEVGTGFHPELTGRENIYLNGAILGMKKAEIVRKLDEIIDFAEIAQFIDTPVKRYSSGMYVRLAFAVAAHLEPEILVIDEVLAVGDSAFQKKCLGKIQDVSSHGRTILFVSHNMGMITSLCSRGLLLDRGRLVSTGTAPEVVLSYFGRDGSAPYSADFRRGPKPIGDHLARLLEAHIEDAAGNTTGEVDIRQPFRVTMRYQLRQPTPVAPGPNFHFYDTRGEVAFISGSTEYDRCTGAEPGTYVACCEIPGQLLNSETYFIGLALTFVFPNVHVSFFERDALAVTVVDPIGETLDNLRNGYSGSIPGIVRPRLDWTIQRQS
ncbi:ABC transporter ATP-binding protein [uncultured Thiodictyon sp.]|uniref:ABC transporter ATP-binding protein n=1 Tax=uncultured Thiodictyon sp. TaxID=1846217 RepID=UPI0025EC0230|nr:ABC transporter ATP-binding protein [uncultured Thiodictyon sp.]